MEENGVLTGENFLQLEARFFSNLSLAFTDYDHFLLPRPVLLTLNDTF